MSELSKRLARLSPAKRKLLEKRLKQNPKVTEPIAVVGMGCRFPGGANLRQYWRLISEGIDATSEIPPSRWLIDDLYDPTGEESGKMSVRWGAFIDGEDQFDSMFFGITPREATKMDPQQRLLLEVAWEALEYGGLAPQRLSGSNTGVFVGIGGTDYSRVPIQYDDYYAHIDAHAGTGNTLSIASNRVSYVFNLKGPSLSVDTACSSSLMAVHLAVQSLRNRECEAALAGGVNMILSPETTIAFSKAHMLSTDGKCRPFDAGANGYVRGEGCGMIVLKRLTDAVAAGDHVLAVIRNTAVNQDGRTSGITAPNSNAQIDVIRSALAGAGISPDQINYVEAHGTGTPLGDPIEVLALGKVFHDQDRTKPPLYMSSVKANIGHTETVSSMASIIKVILMMQHGTIPPQLHFEELNPNISLEGTRLRVPAERTAWTPENGPRMAGISSFGFGGSNAHLILEEASPSKLADSPEPKRPLQILAVSAKSETALAKLAEDYAQDLASRTDAELADFCHTANAGRSHFNVRLAITAKNRDQMRQRLESVAEGKMSAGAKKGQVRTVTRPKVAFLFTGQGSQYVEMGRLLFDSEPKFRQTLKRCDEILRDELDAPLLSALYPESAEGNQSLLDQTAFTQPALFALEYSLATLWRSWGVEPSVLIGHSVGEYAAACLASVFSLEDGLRLIAMRGRLMQQLPEGGTMAVIFAPTTKVAEAVKPFADRVSLAANNGPQNTVISGDAEAVQAIVDEFKAADVRTKMLTVSHAFHSHRMDPILDEFERFAGEMEFRRPLIPLISNLTGELLTQAPDARYWRDHIRNTVRFTEGMERLADLQAAGPDAMLEIGPTPHLLPIGRRILPKLEVPWLPSLRQNQDDWRVLLGALSDLYVLGADVNWKAFDEPRPSRRLNLPTYPFERKRHWFTPVNGPGYRTSTVHRGPALHPLLGCVVNSPLEQTLFEVRMSGKSPSYMKDHQVQGSPVTPAAAYVEQGLAAADQMFGPGMHVLENLSIQNAMFLPEGSPRTVQVSVSPESGGACSFEVYSAPTEDGEQKLSWTLHACGKVYHRRDDETEPTDGEKLTIDLDEVRSRVIAEDTRDAFYEQMASRGLAYGPAFQVLDDLRRTESEALAEIRLSKQVTAELEKYRLHPALLDACFQSVAGIVPLEADGSYSSYTYMPTGVRRVCIRGPLAEQMFTYAVRTSEDSQPSPEIVEGDVYLVDGQGRVLVEMSGVRVQRLGRAAGNSQEIADVRDWLYRIRWQPLALPEPLESDFVNSGESNGSPKPTVQPGVWLIFADAANVGNELAAELRRQYGQHTVLVRPGEAFREIGRPNREKLDETIELFEIDPLSRSDYERLLHTLFEPTPDRKHPRCAGVIHLWSLDVPAADVDGSPNEQMAAEARRLGCGSALPLIRELARCKHFDRPPALCFATRGAQDVAQASGFAAAIAPGQSPLWGLGRVADMEHPELQIRLIDLDPAEGPAADALQLLREVFAEPGDKENQIAYRAGGRYVARLAATPELLAKELGEEQTGLTLPAEGAAQLRVGKSSGIDHLQFASFVPQPPEPGQVEIEVRATGLNFSDVLKAMGLYPGIRDEIVPLGIECSGVVTAVGEGVTRFKPGDEVMGVAPYSFATHTRSAEYALVHKPMNLSHAEACTVSVTFLTAYYALRKLADLQPGERVLIHAGAGGVGLAAIQIAQQIGAEIFATAGSEEKRDYLRSLGVKHVYSTRTLDFADEILESTGRDGVDVVLNSLPGDAIGKSLGVLRAYGRFLEIGKIDIYQNRMIGLLPFQDNLSYFAIDLDRMLRQRPDYIREMFAEIMERFSTGDYRPLEFTEFDMDDVSSAFRYMAQRKNIGKVVVELDSPQDRRREKADDEAADSANSELIEDAPSDRLFRQDGTYLVTGGLGSLGLQVASWLTEQGAGNLVLMSRRAPSGEAADAIESLQKENVSVVAVQGDVTDPDSLAEALAKIPKQFPPLRGVIHAAGVLADGVLFDMDLRQLDKAMAPKVQGTWNLHTATLDAPLDFFVMFSSVASVLGSPGQANYAAGNAFLDALCGYRHSQGLPATSINWGPWGGTGMAAAAGREAQLADRGIDLLPPAEALSVLGGLLRLEEKSSPTVVMSARWRDMLKLHRGPTPPLLRDVAPKEHDDGADSAAENPQDREFRQNLIAAEIPRREEMLGEFFKAQLVHIMGLDANDLNTEQPLNTLGLDSLMAIELKINIESRLKVTLPIAQFMENPSILSLAKYLAGAMGESAGEPSPASGAKGSASKETSDKTDQKTPASAELADKWSPLVALQPNGDRPPLVCVHPAGGNVMCYEGLARNMGADQPVYALQASGVDGLREPHASIEDMVDDYLAALRDLQPQGPYYLAAWSSGGPIAYEMAYRLKQDGDEVGLLAMIDSWPSLVNIDLDDDAGFLCELASFISRFYDAPMRVSYEELSQLDSDGQLKLILKRAEKTGIVSALFDVDSLRRFVNLGKANLRIMMNHRLTPCDLPIHFFRAAQTDGISEKIRGNAETDYGWSELVGESLEIQETPGDHITMLTGENVQQLAGRLRECIGAVASSTRLP